MKAQIYRDQFFQWRWRVLTYDGRIVANSADSWDSASTARQGLEVVRAGFAGGLVVDQILLDWQPNRPPKGEAPA